MLAKALKQLFNQTGLRKRLSEQPQRRAVRNAVNRDGAIRGIRSAHARRS
jgi:hypothetical protein